jgi:cellobiose phosphorylase
MWRERTGAFRLRSPSPRLDAYLNGWALYQTLACRLMGRSSLYQSGGAFGFRDQLQDVCALTDTLPELAKRQILLAAAHQYREGDVMHWWHPRADGDRGVRTRCSDDLLWLPYALTVYGEKTGDLGILEEEAPWLASRPLGPEERDRYEAPAREGSGTLMEHALRAIGLVLERGCGPHGLLLMGSGDWNDGMDAVGGESVWLTWFAAMVLDRFASLTGREDLRAGAAGMGKSADAAWTGEWYLRGWYADGRPLGAPGSRECAIDSLAQSFAVLSGFGDPEKSRRAVKKAAEVLLDPEQGTVRLFTPPFNGLEKPGYIRSYLPGVRENGGQYTHAAVWLAAACLRCGETALGWRLLETLLPGERPEEVYQGEPYVLAADVYTHPDMPGRAGWTWYTGAAGWFLRTAVEELLGLRMRAGRLHVEPKLPESWPGYEARMKAGDRSWQIRVRRGEEPEITESIGE